MRALHTKYDRPALIEDDWADRFVLDHEREELASVLLSKMTPAERESLTGASANATLHSAWRTTPMYASVVVRTRYTEEHVAAAIERGVGQYVVLGAGFDSFAMRRPDFARDAHVFEIDHPASQALKRSRLDASGQAIPSTLHFVPSVLGEQDLGSALARTEFAFDKPAIVSWLGVTMYLTREANLATLRSIARATAAGTDLVFTYIAQEGLDSDATTVRWAKAAVQSVGESWRSGFDPATIGDVLREVGFDLMDDFGGAEARQRYCADRTDGFVPGGAGRIAWARVR